MGKEFDEEKKAALQDIDEAERALEVAHKIVSDLKGYQSAALSELSRLQRLAAASAEASRRLKTRAGEWSEMVQLFSE